MHADPKLFSGCKLHIDEKIACSVGKYIMVIKTGGAAGFKQFSKPCERREAHDIAIQVFPDLIERNQPIKQRKALHSRKITGKNLVEVMVRIDQPGVTKHVRSIENRSFCAQVMAESTDHTILDQQIRVFYDAIAVVTGDDGADVF